VLAVGLALLAERLDRRLRDPEDAKAIFDRPILTMIPESDQLARDVGPLPMSIAEPFRMLRANLRYFNIDREVGSVLVTSAQPGDGKSTVAWNLAWASASAGKRTLLIEADLRRPSLASWTHRVSRIGLSGLLSNQGELQDAITTVGNQDDGDAAAIPYSIDVVFAGPLPPNPDELIESGRMTHVIEAAQREYDLVIIDTPPTSVVSDAIPLVKDVDGILVVARLGRTSKDTAARLGQQLENLGARVLGVVVNGVSARGPGYEYGYGYGYDAPPAATGRGEFERDVVRT
jgi:capsular exopolysaccharide synthesis family protein